MPSITSFHRLAIGAAASALSALHAAPAAAKGPVVLPYFLPKTVVSATFSQRLTSCPDDAARSSADNKRARVKVITKWTLAADVGPDYSMPILIDASSGFLAKRNVGIKYNADGTLSALNADSSGQGGAVVASVIKLAATIAPFAAAAIPWSARSVFSCTAATKTALKELDGIKVNIATIQNDITNKTATADQLTALAEFQARRSALESELTIKSSDRFVFDPENPDRFDPEDLLDPNPDHGGEFDAGKLKSIDPKKHGLPVQYFKPLDYGAWFGGAPAPDYVPGAKLGFKAKIDIDQDALLARRLAPAFPKPVGVWNVAAQQKMYFRWPVPAGLSVVACGDNRKVNCDKDPQLTAAMTNTSLDFSMPQLAYLTAIPVGSAGIFGSRTVKASFDETGAPVELSYGSDPGADAIAGTVDAVGGTAVAIHDRKLAAAKYQLELEDTNAKLAAARAVAAAKEE